MKEQEAMKALIVDDSSMMRNMLQHYASEMSFETTLAEDGADGVAKMKEEGPFELMLVDWDMPVMNGLEFVKAVRNDPENADSKILMVTSHNSMDDVITAMSVGIDDFLMKPIEEVGLKDKLTILGF